MSYTPFPLNPTTLEEMASWVNEELARVAGELAKLELLELNVAPTKPFNGMRVIADGANWNPGSGRGVYWYDASDASWNFLG